MSMRSRGAEVSFEDFVRARSGSLLRTALLLTGQSRAEAEDLLQIALERAYRHWPRIYPVGQIAVTPDGKTAYVAFGSDVTPINTATGTPGKTIHVGSQLNGALDTQIVITPDGKTAYLITGSGVTPISTATDTPGKTIHVGGRVFQAIAITP